MATRADPDINLLDAETQQCPYDAYRTLRNEAPVYKQPGTDIYVITRYEDVRRVLLDPDAFPSSPKKFAAFNKTGSAERQQAVQQRFREKGWVPEPTLSSRDDPNHKQMRAMFNEAFRPSKIKTMDPLVETLAYELIDGFIADGECNRVSQFAVPIGANVLGGYGAGPTPSFTGYR